MKTAYMCANPNTRPASRTTRAFALSAVLSIIGAGLFAATASASDTSPRSAIASVIGGPLDIGFGTGGKLTTNVSGNDDGNSVAIQADGKIVVAGTSFVNGSQDFSVARYNTNGTLDTTFDTDGKLTTDFGGSDQGTSVAISNGKIVVAGVSYVNQASGYDFALARYNSDGTLDTTFDTDGKLTTAIGTTDVATSVAIFDGKIVVAGYSNMNNNYEFALARYNSDGTLDTTFDADGKLTTDIRQNDFGYSMAIQTDGKIVVAGYSGNNNDFSLARYTTNGTLDTTFDTDGTLTTDMGGVDYGNSVAIQTDGKIVVAGVTSYNDVALARYTTNGTLDTTFDTDGKLTTDFGGADYGNSVAIQTDGRILVAGSGSSGNDFTLARYTTTGALDTTFDTDGKLTTDFGGDDFGNSVAIQTDGKIVVAGTSALNEIGDFALARYDTTAPTVTLAASLATSLSPTISFTITGGKDIDCTTLSTTSGEDFTFTNISAITAITQTSSAVCTITATSTAIANGVAVISTLRAATTFSITGTNTDAQTLLISAPQSVTVTIADATPATTVPATASTTTVPANTTVTPTEVVIRALPRTRLTRFMIALGVNVSATQTGFTPGETVQLIVASTPRIIGTGVADQSGSVTVDGIIPTDLEAGVHTLALYSPANGLGFSESFTVGPVTLPATGTNTKTPLVLTLLLLIGGAMVLTMNSRKRKYQS